jgi:hypothetical protein
LDCFDDPNIQEDKTLSNQEAQNSSNEEIYSAMLVYRACTRTTEILVSNFLTTSFLRQFENITMDDELLKSRKALASITAIFTSYLLLILAPSFPLLTTPGTDNSVFLYLGSRLLEGDIPYQDLWDHKGPFLYLINALGFLVTGGSLWGVWMLQLVSLVGAAVLGFVALRHLFNTATALIASMMWIAALPSVLDGGNLTETWGLPLQFGTLLLLALLVKGMKNGETRRLYLIALGIGALGALAFLLRANEVSIWVAAGIVLLVRSTVLGQIALYLRLVLAAAVGALIVSLPFLIFFLANGAFGALWDSMIVYNLTYTSNNSIENRILATARLLYTVGTSGSGIVIAGGFGILIAGAMKLTSGRNDATKSKIPVIVQIALIALPMEMLVSGVLSGQHWAHYAQPWLPALTILAAFTIFIVLRSISFQSSSNSIVPVRAGIVGLFVIAIVSIPTLLMFNTLYKTFTEPVNEPAIVKYIQSTTDQNDSILVWGAEVDYYLLADRHSPTRFITSYPLFAPGYSSEGLYVEFTDAVLQAKPMLIIDAANVHRVPKLDSSGAVSNDSCWRSKCTFQTSSQFDRFLAFVASDYQLDKTIDPEEYGVEVYRRKDSIE